MRKTFILAVLFLVGSTTNSQQVYKDTLTHKTIGELLGSLKNKIADTSKIDIYLRLAEDILQNGFFNDQHRLDSAAFLIKKAKALNTKLISGRRDGLIFLRESSLMTLIGDTSTAKELLSQSLQYFQRTGDNFHIILTLMSMSASHDITLSSNEQKTWKILDQMFRLISTLTLKNKILECLSELQHFYSIRLSLATNFTKLNFLSHFILTCQKGNERIKEFWARKEIADIHYQQGKISQAIEELLIIKKEQETGKFPHICFTYDLLSAFYSPKGNLDTALYYSLKAVKSASSALDSLWLSNFYIRVAWNYSRSGSLAEAINWNMKQLDYVIARNETYFIYVTILDITSAMISLGRQSEALDFIIDKRNHFIPYSNNEKSSMLLSLAQCYVAVNNNSMAEKYCEELSRLHEIRVRQKEIKSDLAAETFLASFYLNIGQIDKAERFYNRYKGEISKGNTHYQMGEKYFLFKRDSIKKKYISAIGYLQNYHSLKDSVFTATKSKQVEELKITYATEQKDSLLKLNELNIQLLTRQDQFQKSKLQQGAILRNISFAVLGLLIIIMALLYNRYRLKQRTNRKLEVQQAEIENKNASLHHLLNEKEWLLKEIHHRVKNNLQMVMSLLNSQSVYIANDAALTAIHDSQHRVHAMSLIHQKLYNSEKVSSIDMSVYIRELVSYLGDSFDTGQRIRFELNVVQLEMDVSQAIPLGLILNEAITNAIKYAFPDKRKGVISVSLSNTGPDHYLLNISDNGVGMPPDISNKKQGSLGMSLMKGLSQELGGNISIENNSGTAVKITFVYDPGVKRSSTLTQSFASNN